MAFKSQPGRGSIFWLELPLYVDSTETDRLREEELPQASVLVLEPHKESREIIGMYLGRWGCKFTMVDFVDKDSVLDEMDIDLIISDYSVDNSTLNLSPSVKNSLSGVPHLLLWDQFDKVQNIEELKSCGISAVLAKPFKPRILKEMMRSLLRSVEEGKLLLDTSFETQTLHISELLNKQPLSGYNFLVVEDNIVNQRIVSKILLNLGAEVGQAANGVEALQMISDFSYDVILMDCQMPYMNGFDATRKIREMTQLDKNEVPVIAMTADVMVVNRKRCIEAGMDDYMTKPFNRVTFLKLVYKYLDR
ncbi:MAG: response regulator [Lentisphaeraceae bacterium]|nr:response regulator [Lentisphaeraceae bacterium]